MLSLSRISLLAAALAPLAVTAQTGAPKCPNVLVIFDVSCSMGSPLAGSTRYEIAQGAIESITAANDDTVRFGLELFGMSPGCGVSSPTCFYPDAGCQSVSSDFNTSDEIVASIDARGPEGATPTSAAIIEATKRADMMDLERSRYALLVTDGRPEQCGFPNTDAGQVQAANATVQEIDSFRTDAGVRTFILGFGNGIQDPDKANLARMATAGGTARTGCDGGAGCYYQAGNAAELQSALDAILQVVSGELGGQGACDESCYGQGCPAGQVCKNAACVSDPCASLTCSPGEVCLDGACQKTCAVSCGPNRHCLNGQCVDEEPCLGGCPSRNQICVAGSCQEDYCSGSTKTLACPAGTMCYRNGCAPAGPGMTPADGGTRLPDGGVGPPGSPQGCCTGAPSAFSAFALLVGLSTLALRRRRRS